MATQYTFNFADEPYTALYIQKPAEIESTLKKVYESDAKLIGIDLETGKKIQHPQAGLDPHLSFIRLIQLYDGKTTYVIDTQSEGVADYTYFYKILKEKRLIAHYAIFEIKHLMYHFTEPTDIHCSKLIADFIYHAEHSPYEPDDEDDEEKPKFIRGLGLGALAERYFGIKIPKQYQKSDWNKRELDKEQIIYAALDAVLTYKLGKLLVEKLNKYRLSDCYKLYKDMQHVIAEMELNGFLIDTKEHNRLIAEWTKKRDHHREVCREFFGSVNLRSSKKLHQWVQRYYADNKDLLKRWPKSEKTGNYSFSKLKLADLEPLEPVQAILAYKKYATLLSTFGESLQQKISPKTGRIHCNFTLGETRTGRLSSRNPNLQNMPARDDSFRHIFIAPTNHALVVADFSQVEVRVAGELSKDPVIRRAFDQGVDLHKAIVAAVSGKSIDEITKEERQLGKALNFGLQFGMGPTKLAKYARNSYGVELSEEEARHAWEVYHSTYRRYSSWCQEQRKKAERQGIVSTPLGRKRKLAETEIYTKAVNTPVQGGAAEVSLAALVYLRRLLRQKPAYDPVKIINTVHDEIILECPEDMVEDVMHLLTTSMEYGMKSIFPRATTHGLAEAASGRSWAEAK